MRTKSYSPRGFNRFCQIKVRDKRDKRDKSFGVTPKSETAKMSAFAGNRNCNTSGAKALIAVAFYGTAKVVP
jgi:hypothetical protein